MVWQAASCNLWLDFIHYHLNHSSMWHRSVAGPSQQLNIHNPGRRKLAQIIIHKMGTQSMPGPDWSFNQQVDCSVSVQQRPQNMITQPFVLAQSYLLWLAYAGPAQCQGEKADWEKCRKSRACILCFDTGLFSPHTGYIIYIQALWYGSITITTFYPELNVARVISPHYRIQQYSLSTHSTG